MRLLGIFCGGWGGLRIFFLLGGKLSYHLSKVFHGEINQVSIMRDSMYENANQYLHKHLLEYLFFSVINIESFAKQEVVSF